MSSLHPISLIKSVYLQYQFKLSAYHNMIGSIVLFQVVGLFLAYFGEETSISVNDYSITNHVYHVDSIILFSLIWLVILALYVTNRQSRAVMYSFVTDKRSNHLANSLFMITVCAFAAISAVLMGVLLRLILVLSLPQAQLLLIDRLSFRELLLAIWVVFLYHLLLFSIAYVIGEIVQVHPVFLLLLPIVLIGSLILSVNQFGSVLFIEFYVREPVLWRFIFKTLATILLLWLMSLGINRKLEVKRS